MRKSASRDPQVFRGHVPLKSLVSREIERLLSLAQKVCRFESEIRENAVGAGAFKGDQAFHNRPFALEPAALRRRHKHRVLARDLICEGGKTERLPDAPDDI